jgi:STE24 endopeptidase
MQDSSHPDQTTEPPVSDTPAGMTPEQLAEARQYGRYSLACTLIDKLLDVIYLTAATFILARPLDAWLEHAWPLLARWASLRLVALYFVVMLLHMAISLPLVYYSGHVLEHRFHLSNLSFGGWIARYMKRNALALAFGVALILGLYWLIWTTGPWWWLAAAGAFFCVTIILGKIFPLLIMPLFYKIERLDEPELAERMNELAAGTGLGIEGVYRIALSQETVKANAMLAGVGRSRRVLLGDTLLSHFSPDEIAVVFAHEIGHHVFRHVRKMLALGLVITIAGFAICDALLKALVAKGGESLNYSQLPVWTVPGILLILTLFGMLLEPLMNAISRRHERQCDRYALQRTRQPEAYVSAFNKLAQQNKDDPDPHWLEVFWLHDHPPIAERLAMAGEIK